MENKTAIICGCIVACIGIGAISLAIDGKHKDDRIDKLYDNQQKIVSTVNNSSLTSEQKTDVIKSTNSNTEETVRVIQNSGEIFKQQ